MNNTAPGHGDASLTSEKHALAASQLTGSKRPKPLLGIRFANIGSAMFLRSVTIYLCATLLYLSAGYGQGRRADQARQFLQQTPTAQAEVTTQQPTLNGVQNLSEDESFGVQQILKRQEKLKPFRFFADATGYYTSNAALTRTNEISDAFLVGSVGTEYRRPLPYGLQWEATVRGATFRYNELTVLSFQSLDAGTGLAYHASKLWDLDFSARYNYTQLWGDQSGDTFFTNHTFTLAAQRAYSFSRAHYVYAGISALLALSDPKEAQRNEYSAYAGYHLQATRRISADLFYRFAYYDYARFGRGDVNNALTVSARYEITKYLAAFASYTLSANRSNREVFDYDVANGGGGLGLSLSF